MQLYDITIATNTTRQLDAPGSYFYYYAGNAGGADSTITLRGVSSGLRLILKPGQAFRLPNGQTETSWILTNYANGATIIGTVLVGDGDITDNRVTGSVEIIDGGKNRTIAGTAFSGYAGTNPAAGMYSHAQLWNPSNSGKNAVIEQIIIGTGTAGGINFRFANTSLTTLLSSAGSKKSGGPATVMEQRGQLNASFIGSGSFNAAITLQASIPFTYKFSEPMVITPGYGLVIVPGTQNAYIDANFEYFEENI